MNIGGTKTITAPTPPIIPSAIRGESHSVVIKLPTHPPSQLTPTSIQSINGVLIVKVSWNKSHIANKNIGIPRNLLVTTLSILSDIESLSIFGFFNESFTICKRSLRKLP